MQVQNANLRQYSFCVMKFTNSDKNNINNNNNNNNNNSNNDNDNNINTVVDP